MSIQYVDQSANTNLAVFRPLAGVKRKGVCLHESIGEHSLGWLAGGSLNSGAPVSCDYLIDRDGTINQIGKPGYYAWHTGLALYDGYRDPDGSLNMSLVGIELENLPSAGEKVTNAQYIAAAALVRRLAMYHGFGPRWVVGHYMICVPSGRKSDPLTMSWPIFWREYLAPSAEGLALRFPEVLL